MQKAIANVGVEQANSVRSFNGADDESNAGSEGAVHSVHNGLNPEWSRPSIYATGSLVDARRNDAGFGFNDVASLSSLPMSPSFSYASLPTFPCSRSPFVPLTLSTSNLSHQSSSENQSDLLLDFNLLNHQYHALASNQRLNQLFLSKERDRDREEDVRVRDQAGIKVDFVNDPNDKEMSVEIVITPDELQDLEEKEIEIKDDINDDDDCGVSC